MKYLLMVVLLFSFSQGGADLIQSLSDGNALLERCEAYLSDTGSAAKGNVCFGYVTGVVDVHNVFVSNNEMNPFWCAPDGINSSQLVRIVTKYLQEIPEALHFSASSIIIFALRDAFPCE